MIIYITDRSFTVVGRAATYGGDNVMRIFNDKYSRDVKTGTATLEVSVHYPKGKKREYKEIFKPGNYILYHNPDTQDECKKKGLFTIIDYKSDSSDNSITVYGEDAGLELINETLTGYTAPEAHNIEWYVNRTISDTGFTIGKNEYGTATTKQLKFESEQTRKERLQEIASQFGAEMTYDFTITGMRVTGFQINIFKKMGDQDTVKHLRVGEEISALREEVSFADLATGFIVVGGTGTGSIPINLDGYSYDDGDIYTSGRYIYSRTALAKWARYNPSTMQQVTDISGHIVKRFQFDTVSQERLCSEAVKELRRVKDLVTTYEAEVFVLPEDIGIGDKVIIDDDTENAHLQARIVSLEDSDYSGDRSVILEVTGDL